MSPRQSLAVRRTEISETHPSELAISVPEAARRLNISERSAWRLVWTNTLPSVRVGKHLVRVPVAALERFVCGEPTPVKGQKRHAA